MSTYAGPEQMRRYRERRPEWVVTERQANAAYKQRRNAERRALIGRIKLDRGCVDHGLYGLECAGLTRSEALDFDHVGDDKVLSVASMVSQNCPWATIEAEIAKCEVVCAGHHRIRTEQRRSA